jgi:hypothetical protein
LGRSGAVCSVMLGKDYTPLIYSLNLNGAVPMWLS